MATFSGQEEMTDEGLDDLFGDLTQEPIEEEQPGETDTEQPVDDPAEEIQPPVAESAVTEVEGESPEEVASPAAETTSEPPTSTEEETYKKRWQGLRNSRDQAIESERARAEQAEQMLASLLGQQEQAKIAPERLAELAKRAEEAGMDPAAVGIYADITSEAVDARTQVLQSQMLAQAQAERRGAEERQAASERELVAEFLDTHQDLPEDKRPELARVLHDIGAARFVDAQGNDLPVNFVDAQGNDTEIPVPYEQKLATGNLKTWEPLTPEILDIAYEAVTQESLGTVLRALPQLYESEEGMQTARRLASAPELTHQPVAPAVTHRNVDEALAAAETLSGPSAPAPPVEDDWLVKPSSEAFFAK